MNDCLDTNVISALMQASPEPAVVAWLNAMPSADVCTTSVCVFEILIGLAALPVERRRQLHQTSFERVLRQDLGGQVLIFGAGAAAEAASIGEKARLLGRPIETRDLMIAGVVAADGCILATRNMKHFSDAGIALINPWTTRVSP